MGKLNAKQQAFCEEYVIDFNGTQAAIRAGYTKKSARVTASKLLTKANIQNYLQELQEQRQDRHKVLEAKVIAELEALAFVDMTMIRDDDGNLKPLNEWPKDARKAIAEIHNYWTGRGEFAEQIHKVKFHNKEKALDMLMKYLGLYEKDNEQQSGDQPDVMIIQLPDNGR